MDKIKKKHLPWLNGLVTAVLIYLIIPLLFVRAMPDFIWIALMFILPVIPAVYLFHTVDRQPPKAAFKGFWVECLIAVVFFYPMGRMWSYGLRALADWDLFDFIPYFIHTLGFALGATLVQFVILWLMHKESKQ